MYAFSQGCECLKYDSLQYEFRCDGKKDAFVC